MHVVKHSLYLLATGCVNPSTHMFWRNLISKGNTKHIKMKEIDWEWGLGATFGRTSSEE